MLILVSVLEIDGEMYVIVYEQAKKVECMRDWIS